MTNEDSARFVQGKVRLDDSDDTITEEDATNFLDSFRDMRPPPIRYERNGVPLNYEMIQWQALRMGALRAELEMLRAENQKLHRRVAEHDRTTTETVKKLSRGDKKPELPAKSANPERMTGT